MRWKERQAICRGDGTGLEIIESGTGDAGQPMIAVQPMRLLLAQIALALWPFQAFACSREDGEEWDTPSNFELVQQADLIVLGRIIQGPADLDVIDALTLDPVEVLKGDLKDEQLIVGGMTDWNGEAIAPIVTPLAENHFSSGLGACIRMFYQPDELVLAVFKRSPGPENEDDSHAPFIPHIDPSSRNIESVSGPNDIWVEAVKLYIAIAATPGDHLAQLARARDALRARGDFAGNAIANDIGWALSDDETYDYWDAFNLPTATLAFLRDPVAREQASLVCALEEGGLRLITQRGATFELIVGDTAFTVAETQERELPAPFGETEKQVIRTSSFLDETALLSRLGSRHEQVSLKIDGTNFASAPPGDVLLRFSQRCSEILQAIPGEAS